MNIVWLTWKDQRHPRAGGAEVVSGQLAKRLAADGHRVKFIVGGFNGGKATQVVNSCEVNRVGGRASVYFKAWRFYRRQKLYNWADLVIDEVNTIPFMAKFYASPRRFFFHFLLAPFTSKPSYPKPASLLFIHQLARQVWFYELPKPLGAIGYLLEPLYLRLLGNSRAITVSNSTKQDLIRFGFKSRNIKIISEGIEMRPLPALGPKPSIPTLLSLGAIKPMKRTMDQLRAFELAKAKIPQLRLKLAGALRGKYGQKVLRAIAQSPYSNDIEYLGKVSPAQKIKLLQGACLICVTSVKEGWGLVVTEAASQGTPAIVYNVDGLRDSVRNNQTGCIVSNNTPQALAVKIEGLISNAVFYEKLRKNAWRWSSEINFDKSYDQFKKFIKI